MEPIPENKTAEQFLAELEATRRTIQANYEEEQNNLANLELQRADADDSIDLIEDDIHILCEDAVPDVLLFKALKADMLMTMDGLNEITQAIEAKNAFIEKLTEGLNKADGGIHAMKKFIARTGVVLPFKKG
jgi:hypothetical protein